MVTNSCDFIEFSCTICAAIVSSTEIFQVKSGCGFENWDVHLLSHICINCTVYTVHCTFSQHSNPYSHTHNVNSQRWRAIDQKWKEKNWARDRNIKCFNWDCKWQTVFQLLACLSTVLRMLRWWQWLHHRQVGKIPHCQTTKRHDKQTERVEESLE